MKQPKLRPGSGTLGRYKRPQPIVHMSLQDNGYGSGTSLGGAPPSNWTCMTVREARKLALRLQRCADRAEGRRA